jgi:hypothetical protein
VSDDQVGDDIDDGVEHDQDVCPSLYAQAIRKGTPGIDLKPEAVAEYSHSRKNLEFSETANRKTHKQVLDETSDGG